MQIMGLQKLTLLDFPGKVACTVFTSLCNFRCPFCHNASLVLPEQAMSLPEIGREEFFSFLRKRQGLLDGVCITGGEPTLHSDLPELIAEIRALGYAIKLDTNGSRPEMLRRMLDEGLLDYVAMDIKNGPSRYDETIGATGLLDAVRESAAMLKEGSTPFEFRTTVVDELHDDNSFVEIGEWVGGDIPYFLQSFVDSGNLLCPGLHAPSDEAMKRYLTIAKQYFPAAALRGR